MDVFRCVKLVNGVHTTRSQIIFGLSVMRRFSTILDKDNTETLPVLIVGAGPVGLALSVLLTKLGVNCEILEKNKAFSQHPQAHFINNRSMEIFRKFDDLTDKIQRLQPPVELWRKFIYCTSLSGSILGSVNHIEPEDIDQVVSPVSVAHFSQYKLNKLLLEQIKNLGFHGCTNDELNSSNYEAIRGKRILMGHECKSIKATDHGIMVGVSSSENGKNVERNILCKLLIGSDGAGSVVRKLMGIEMNGEKDLQKLISVHFMSKDLGQYLLNERPGMLFFIFNVEAIGVLVAHDLNQGEFVLQIPFYPPQQNIKDFTSEVCKDLILKLAGRKFEDINVRDIKPWVMHAEVAEKFVSCDNRVLLVGDAAHRFPPAGGFGMNTGIQDVHNLAWKIASYLKGISPSSILHTYETERRPIALFNTALSVENFKAAMSVPCALGLDPTVANSVHRVVNSTVGSILPSGLQKSILDGIFRIGRAQVGENLLSENNPLGSSRLAKLKRIFDEGKSLQLQFPAEDLGFKYMEGALVGDIDRSQNKQEIPTGRRRDYIPSAEPGARLPHMNIRILPSEGKTLSTLDLVSGDKLEFVLIISPKKKSYELAEAATRVAEKFSVGLKVCVLWEEGCGGTKKLRRDDYVDIEEVKKGKLSWWEMCRMEDNGAILVRPDEHIAWRSKDNELLNDPVLEMQKRHDDLSLMYTNLIEDSDVSSADSTVSSSEENIHVCGKAVASFEEIVPVTAEFWELEESEDETESPSSSASYLFQKDKEKKHMRERKRWENSASKLKENLRKKEESLWTEDIPEGFSMGEHIQIDGEIFDGLAIVKMLIPPSRAKRSRLAFHYWSSLVGRPLLRKLREAGIDIDLDLFGKDHLVSAIKH